MAIAFDASSPAWAATNTATATTASFTPPSGSLLVVCTGSGSTGRTVTITSSSGLTFTQRAGKNDAGNASIYIYTAPVAVSAAMTVTATYNTGSSCGVKVWVVTGADLAAPVGATFAASSSGSTWSPTLYTSTVAGSTPVFMVEWFSGTLSSTDVAETSSTSIFAISGHKASPTATAGTSVSTTVSSTSSSSVAGIAVEVLPLAGITLTGINTAEAFGTAQLNLGISPSGISSGEAFGTPTLIYSQTIGLAGIASGEAFGTSKLNLTVSPSGIASGEVWGSSFVGNGIGPTSIPSAEAWGSAKVLIQQFVSPTGIDTEEAWGSPELTIGYPQSVDLAGIESQERFGYNTAVKLVHRLVLSTHSVQETPAAWNNLHRRFGIARGISILKRADGTYAEARYPSLDEIAEALAYYMGGAKHVISPSVAAELQAAGFGDLIHLELIE